MPYKSKKQRALFHALEARGEMSSETVKRWDTETGGRKLPEYVSAEAKKRALQKLGKRGK